MPSINYEINGAKTKVITMTGDMVVYQLEDGRKFRVGRKWWDSHAKKSAGDAIYVTTDVRAAIEKLKAGQETVMSDTTFNTVKARLDTATKKRISVLGDTPEGNVRVKLKPVVKDAAPDAKIAKKEAKIKELEKQSEELSEQERTARDAGRFPLSLSIRKKRVAVDKQITKLQEEINTLKKTGNDSEMEEKGMKYSVKDATMKKVKELKKGDKFKLRGGEYEVISSEVKGRQDSIYLTVKDLNSGDTKTIILSAENNVPMDASKKWQVTIITAGKKQRKEVFVEAENKEEAITKARNEYMPWKISGVMAYDAKSVFDSLEEELTGKAADSTITDLTKTIEGRTGRKIRWELGKKYEAIDVKTNERIAVYNPKTGKLEISSFALSKDSMPDTSMDAGKIISKKNGYTLGINNSGTLYLAFPGETENNPHMYLGKGDKMLDLSKAKEMLDTFANSRKNGKDATVNLNHLGQDKKAMDNAAQSMADKWNATNAFAKPAKDSVMSDLTKTVEERTGRKIRWEIGKKYEAIDTKTGERIAVYNPKNQKLEISSFALK